MRNPWLDLPEDGDLVLAIDEPFVDVHNRLFGISSPYYLHLDSPPSPFIGRFDAPFVVLLANPGHARQDRDEQNEPTRRLSILEGLRTEGGSTFWPLTPEFEGTSAGRWWRSRTRELAESLDAGNRELGYQLLSERLLAIELHGYHSTSWFAPRAQFPSQRISVELVRNVIQNGAVILAARAVGCWLAAVPRDGEAQALIDYDNLIKGTRSSQSAFITPNNLEQGKFTAIISVLKP